MSTFDFSTLYTKIPHDKLQYVFNEITDRFFQVGSKIFCQVIGIPMGVDPAPFFANLFCSFINLDG